MSQNQVDATTWQEATDHGYMIILNVAMGGGWPGNPTSSTVSGAPMLVDYVDVTEKSGGGGGTMQGDPITGPGGKCIDVAGDDTGGDTSAVQLWDCQSYAIDQHWTYTNNTLQTLGKCMDISGGSNAEGTKIQLYDCIANDAYQTWIHESNGALYNPVTGYCLDDPYDSTTNGNQLWTWVCNGSDAQTWTSAQFGSSGGSTTIQAESYTNQSGTQTEACSDSGGGQDVGYISNGDWLEYGNLNFGSGLSNFQARVASGAAAGVSGTVSVVLDNLNNAPIGSFSVSNTGGWQTWETVPIGISATSGTHTVYLKFSTGSGQDFTNLNWFTLS